MSEAVFQIGTETKDEWYNLSPEDALQKIGAGRSGLSPQEAGERLLKYGPNELKKKKGTFVLPPKDSG